MDISAQEQEMLLKIYIGQNIREEGILQSELYGQEQIESLLSKKLIRKNHWHLPQFLTTNEGSELGKKLIIEKINDKEKELQNKLRSIPQKALSFFIRRHISKKLVLSTEKPRWTNAWEDHILADSRIWILWDRLFSSLEVLGLCVETHYYVSTRGGELRHLCYVISSEVQEFLTRLSVLQDFTKDQEEVLNVYPVLFSASRVLTADDLGYARQEYYELLKLYSVTEEQIAGIINDTNKIKITSEYRGLLSENKPFDIIDQNRFQLYLDKNIIDSAVNMILEMGGEFKEYTIKKEMPDLSEVKIELGFLEPEELGAFYISVSSLERQLREFLKEKLGKGWIKRIEHDLPNVFRGWQDKTKKDEKWGIEPEKDLMSYADLGDYIEIIKKFNRMFSDGDDELGDIIAHLRIWYNHGRNPIMHARTVNNQKFFTTKSAIEFLQEWMRRKREGPIVIINPLKGTVGEEISITGANFTAREKAEIYIDIVKESNLLNTVNVEPGGIFSTKISVPSIDEGQHYIWVKDGTTGQCVFVSYQVEKA